LSVCSAHGHDEYAKINTNMINKKYVNKNNHGASTTLSVCSAHGHDEYAKNNMNMINNEYAKKQL